MKPYYQDDYATIYHGDCKDIIDDIPSVDLTLIDPPYGIGQSRVCYKQNVKNKKFNQSRLWTKDNWDDNPIASDLLKVIIDKGVHAICFGGNFYVLPRSSCWLVWDKNNGANNFADCELAWTNLPQAVRLFKFKWSGMIQQAGQKQIVRVHPTQKPIQVIKWCITQADKHRRADTILDAFMGSGTTLRAAKDLQRKAIGIEIEEKYCELAAKRLAQEVFNFEDIP